MSCVFGIEVITIPLMQSPLVFSLPMLSCTIPLHVLTTSSDHGTSEPDHDLHGIHNGGQVSPSNTATSIVADSASSLSNPDQVALTDSANLGSQLSTSDPPSNDDETALPEEAHHDPDLGVGPTQPDRVMTLPQT